MKQKLITFSIVAIILIAGTLFFFNFRKTNSVDTAHSGVLALNTNKSVYSLGERVDIGMASLDPDGNTLCRNNLALIITSPSGSQTTLASQTSPTCSEDNNVTNEPDYRAVYTPTEEGIYTLSLTTPNSPTSQKTQFVVGKNQSFSLSRTGATRVNPFKADRYPMTLTLTPQEDFEGKVIEKIPASFEVVWQGSAQAETVGDYKTITWEVNIKAGETKDLIYEYRSPQVSPEFYTLGTAKLLKNNQIAFEENRSWQIASDASTSATFPGTATYVSSTPYDDEVWNTPAEAGGNDGSETTAGVAASSTSTSALYPSAETDAGGGTEDWNAINNADADDDQYDSITDNTFDTGDYSNLLKIQGYGFSGIVPTDATITGVEVKINKYGSVNDVQDRVIQLLNASGTLFGSNLGETSTNWSTNTATIVTYGGAGNMWGLNSSTLTPAIVNDTDFGVGVQIDAVGNNADAYIDYVTIKIYYTTDAPFDTNEYSEILKLTNFNFSIPTNASIDGITVEVERRATAGSGKDALVQLYDSSGTLVGDSKADTVTAWPGTITAKTYGSSSDTWNASLDYADINSSNFGVAIAAQATSDDTTVNIDYVTITITYSMGLSGYVYSAEPSTAFNCSSNNLTLSISIDGAAPSTTTCTSVNGDWTESGLSYTSGSIINVWVSGQASGTVYGETVYVSDGSIKTDINLWQNVLAVRHDTGSNITNANLSTGRYTTKGQQLYTVTGSDLAVDSGIELHIWTGDTYAPGGNVTTPKLHIVGTYSGSTETLTLTGSGTSTARPLYINGGAFTAPATTDFEGTSATDIQVTTFNALTFTPILSGDVVYTFLGSIIVNGDFTINPSGSANTLTVNLAGTTTVASTKTTEVKASDSAASKLDTIDTYALSSGKLTIGAGGTVDANNGTITLTGTSGTIFTKTGTFDVSGGTSTVSFNQTTGNTILTSGSITFDNLTISMNGFSASLGNTITVNNNLEIEGSLYDNGYQVTGNASGTLFLNSSNAYLVLGSEISATTFPTLFTNFDFDPDSTVIYQAGVAQTISHVPSYPNLLLNPGITGSVTYTFSGNTVIDGDFTIEPDAASPQTLTVNMGGTITVASGKTTKISGASSGYSVLDTVNGSNYGLSTGLLNIDATGTLQTRSATITLTGTTGTVFTIVGTFDVSNGTSTVLFNQSTGDTTLILATAGSITFDNLTVNMSGRTGTLGNTITVNDTLTVTAGTLDTSVTNHTINAKDVSIGASGTLKANNSTINVTGNWTNLGAFTYDTSTVDLTGTGAQQISGNTTFYIFSVTTASAQTITFIHDSITSIAENGALMFTGQPGQLLTLTSDTATQWYLRVNPSATTSVFYVDVSESNALQGKQIVAKDSIDSGLNLNWFFGTESSVIQTDFQGVDMQGVDIN